METSINNLSKEFNYPNNHMRVKMMKKDCSDDMVGGGGAADDDKRKRAVGGGTTSAKKGSGGSGSGTGATGSNKSCQAEKCLADLSDAKTYHRRHKVCEHHAKAQVAVVAGVRQRFCQQCSRFHELSEFDEAKRSCRRRLAGHNERRRKNPTDHSPQASEGSASSRIKGSTSSGSPRLKDMVYGQVDDRGRVQITAQENSNYKDYVR